MNYQKILQMFLALVLLFVFGFSSRFLLSTAAQETTPDPAAQALADELVEVWADVTATTIGTTAEWSNKVELADLNGDGLVDILFANGGNYHTPGDPVPSRVFFNQGPGEMFVEATQTVFGDTRMLARVIKVRDINNDGNADIMVGTTFETQSRLYLGDGSGQFTEVTATHLPQIDASIGDLEFGDVDGDGDLDMILAAWGSGSPMRNDGGRTRLWQNDGTGKFSDVTDSQMPDILVKFSFELEFVDVDNDYDLDILISCKVCEGSFLFENDGTGQFTNVTEGRLPQFTNNYEFEAMDLNSDGYLDLVTLNDGLRFREHIFLNNGHGGFEDATSELWPDSINTEFDDGVIVFLDFDSDSDADFLVGSLNGPDRLMINDGKGHLVMAPKVLKVGQGTRGTLYMGIADLNGDSRLDIVEAQGETRGSEDERVYFGTQTQPDTAPPVITLVETVNSAASDQEIPIHARVHDHKSPTMPHDWQAVTLRWDANGQMQERPMTWYGEYLWSGTIADSPPGTISYQICATDAAGNEACSPSQELTLE